jgi:hypothetical protein
MRSTVPVSPSTLRSIKQDELILESAYFMFMIMKMIPVVSKLSGIAGRKT